MNLTSTLRKVSLAAGVAGLLLFGASAGAADIELSIDSADNHVRHDIDGELFLESRVTATATGRPALGVRDKTL